VSQALVRSRRLGSDEVFRALVRGRRDRGELTLNEWIPRERPVPVAPKLATASFSVGRLDRLFCLACRRRHTRVNFREGRGVG